MRLDKYLAEASVGRRKSTRTYVKEGKVSVNGQVVIDPAYEVSEQEDIIEYLDQRILHTGKVYYMFHKPRGCITAREDLTAKTVMDYFSEIDTRGLFPVGRLDKDTEGLLLLTNDGDFDHQLMHPKHHVNKTYFFWAFGSLDEEQQQLLIRGVSIGEGEELACSQKLTIVEQGDFSRFKPQIYTEHLKNLNKKPHNQQVVSGYITISEGRKHQVKRMLRAVGCYVINLKRVSIGGMNLDLALLPGQYRELTKEELQQIYLEQNDCNTGG